MLQMSYPRAPKGALQRIEELVAEGRATAYEANRWARRAQAVAEMLGRGRGKNGAPLYSALRQADGNPY